MATWYQKTFKLQPRTRGCYLISQEIEAQVGKAIENVGIGLCNIFILHTSAGLTINENLHEEVRRDMAKVLDSLAPEGEGKYEHDEEGLDDMPAHVKSTLCGASLNIPITRGKLAMGQYQGIWLMEFRNSSNARSIVVTIQGSRELPEE